jgi:hypothetical protein
MIFHKVSIRRKVTRSIQRRSNNIPITKDLTVPSTIILSWSVYHLPKSKDEVEAREIMDRFKKNVVAIESTVTSEKFKKAYKKKI